MHTRYFEEVNSEVALLPAHNIIFPLNFSVWRYTFDISFASEVLWRLESLSFYNGSLVPLKIGIYHLGAQEYTWETVFERAVKWVTLEGSFTDFSTDYAVAIENQGDRDIQISYSFNLYIFIKSYPYRVAGVALTILGTFTVFFALFPAEKLKGKLKVLQSH